MSHNRAIEPDPEADAEPRPQLSRTICQLLVITLDIYRKCDDDAPRVLQLQQKLR